MSTIPAKPAEARVLDILDEYLAERRAGRSPDRDALLARHPDLAESLAASFRALDFVHDARRTLATPAAAAGREEPAAVGRELGDYRIVREIARGGMAVVYEAEQVSLGRRVALKVLPFAAVLDSRQLQRFKNEAQAAAQIQHPHIVPVYAVGCERGVHYYAMQYVEGQSLAVAIQELKEGGGATGPRTPISSHESHRSPAYIRMAATLGVQAAQALDHAHQVGVVHRDVKPGNLLVDTAGTLWVADFGLAHSRKDVGLTMTGELLGTIRYMSPEQALSKPALVDHRTDVYSLGATLYELLALEPAFPGDDPVQLLKAIASREPTPLRQLNPALPRDLETVLLKAMSKEPAGRYATAQEMADDLARFLEHRPVEARRPGPLRRAVKWGRRHRVLVGTAAGVLVLAVAGLATGTTLLWREQQRTVAEKERAKAGFERAKATLGLAQRVLDEIYLDRAKGDLKVREGIPAERLRTGLGFYEAFAKDNESKVQMAEALYRVSLLLRVLGDGARADETLTAAIEGFREATRLDRDDAAAHFNLGLALRERGDLDLAIASYRDSIQLDPNSEDVYIALAQAHQAKHDLDAAIAAYRAAIHIRSDVASTHCNLGVVLADKGEYDSAIASWREAIRLKKDYALAHFNLGVALASKNDLDGAIQALRDAIQFKLEPDNFEAHYNLGFVLAQKGILDEAIASYQEALKLHPDEPKANCNLGLLLARQGRIQDALPLLRKGHEIGSKEPGWPFPSKKWLEAAEAKARLEARLDQVLSGKARPADAPEQIAFAEMLYAKSRHAESAQMYVEAFAGDAALAEDLSKGHRYNAACSASLAVARGGKDADAWRGKALDWLRAELAARRKAASGLVANLEQWKKDPDLTAVRDHVNEMPEPEREGWRGLWAAVDETVASAGQAPR